MPRAYIALGGNLGDVRRTLNDAVTELCTRVNTRLLARSSDYRTPPWGELDQPPFVNGCICIETNLAPHALLAELHIVERLFGRDRAHERRWGPRTLDLDLIAYDDVAIDTADLILPHPRLFERAFVLLPLAEIAPHLVIAGRSVNEAARAIDASGIEKLPGCVSDHDADPHKRS